MTNEELINYVTVYFMSMIKFFGGPAVGTVVGMSTLEIIIFTVLGMMTTVFIMTFLGKKLRDLYIKKIRKKNYRKFTKSNRRFVYIWRNYGILGVCFLTPVIFSPVVGSLLVTLFGSSPKKVFTFMFFSAIFWAFTLSRLLKLLVASNFFPYDLLP